MAKSPAAAVKPPAKDAEKAPPPAAVTDGAVAATVAHRIFLLAFSDGARASQDAIPFHEVTLLRRKLNVFGQSLTVIIDWPEHSPRERPLTGAGLQEVHRILKERYTFLGNDGQQYDLVTDVYGPSHQGRLLAVMRKQAKAWAQVCKEKAGRVTVEDLEAICRLADPESDLIDAEAEPLFQKS